MIIINFWISNLCFHFSLLQLLVTALEHVKIPSKKEEKKEKFIFTENTKIVKLLLDYMLDVLILPYK